MTTHLRRASIGCAVAILAALSGCDTLFPGKVTAGADAATVNAMQDAIIVGDAGAGDATSSDSQSEDAQDKEAQDKDAAVVDSADAAPSCACAATEVYLDGACVPNGLLGCGKGCLAKAPSACPAQGVCDANAAHLPCQPNEAAAACVPQLTMDPIVGDMRLQPTHINVGEKAAIVVEGGAFYVGALMWWLRMGGVGVMATEWQTKCTLTADWQPTSAGLYAVEAFYAGSGDGGDGHGISLAGYIRVGPGADGAQPGMACGTSKPCLTGDGWSCACASIRCECKAN